MFSSFSVILYMITSITGIYDLISEMRKARRRKQAQFLIFKAFQICTEWNRFLLMALSEYFHAKQFIHAL